MGLKNRVAGAAKRINKPALGAGLALAATYALAVALELRDHDKRSASKFERPATEAPAVAARPAEAERGWPFWKALALRLYKRINDDRLLALAAGVVFYSLLALFPAITALVSSYALFANPNTIGDQLNNLAGLMPESAFGVVREQVVRIVGRTTAGLSFAFIFGLAFAVWSANAGIKAMIDALNIAYDVTERRSFIVLNAASLALTVGAITAVLLAFGAIVIVPVVLAYLPFDGTALVVKWLRWPALALVVVFGLAVLYRFGPNHKHPRWRWITPGAVFAAVMWLAGSALWSWYLANIADYNATYGSLGAAIGLMMWLWVSAIVVLTGAEINAELGYTADDTAELAERAGLTSG